MTVDNIMSKRVMITEAARVHKSFHGQTGVIVGINNDYIDGVGFNTMCLVYLDKPVTDGSDGSVVRTIHLDKDWLTILSDFN